MKSAKAPFGGTPPTPHDRTRRSSQSHTRMPSAAAPGAREQGARREGTRERGRWARCEEPAPEPPRARERRPPATASADEPRTGVVRRVAFESGERQSGLIARAVRRPAPSREPSAAHSERESPRDSGDWRCLEWGSPSRERRPRRDSKVTIVQLSREGDLLRQNGPDEWVPEAGDFVRRMSRLVARGLGFERCRSVCLKSASAVLTVAEAGEKFVAVSGPVRSLTNVLRRAGLE